MPSCAGTSLARRAATAYYCCVVSLIALVFLGLAWELWLAPVRPGGSMLALKVLPLLLPVLGILRGKIYTFQWSTMLILPYLAEGAIRAYTDHGMSARMALIEALLALLFFVASIVYIRTARALT